MSIEKEKIKYLVADTTAFINKVALNELATNILTVPAVVDEVRNRRQIRRLCVLPYDLQVKEPRSESLQFCTDFAKKTGDFASLSAIDMKVIALTYELEIDNIGSEDLRTEPVKGELIASKHKPEELMDSTKIPGFYMPCSVDNQSEIEETNTEVEDTREVLDRNNEDCKPSVNNSETEESSQIIIQNSEKSIATNLNRSDCETNEDNDDELDLSQRELEEILEKCKIEEYSAETEDSMHNILEKNNDQLSEHDSSDETDTDNDSDGWITPQNVQEMKKSIAATLNDVKPLVACITTDYAIQNVLKQINLKVCALDGREIKHLRTYILRCYSCFKTTSIMTKVFCPNCGNKTLKRVSVSMDENGKQVIHVNTRRPLTAKYKNQSLPLFRGGKHSHNPIIVEDQRIPKQMPSRVAKTKTNALDEDYMCGYSPFALRDVDSKSAMLRAKGNLKEWARNNAFRETRRKKYLSHLHK